MFSDKPETLKSGFRNFGTVTVTEQLVGKIQYGQPSLDVPSALLLPILDMNGPCKIHIYAKAMPISTMSVLFEIPFLVR
jgi:hypothetical protein